MNSDEYNMEVLREVWNNKSGECIEIGPDRDALGMIEVRYKDPSGFIGQRIEFPIECAKLVAQAIMLCIDDLDAINQASVKAES